MIYFIQAGEDGPVKIGKANNPKSRLGILQIGSPERLYLRAVLDEPDEVEGVLHEALKGVRMNGEWFVTHLSTLCAMAAAMAGFIYTVPGEFAVICPACEQFKAKAREKMKRYRLRKRKKEG